MVASIPNDIFQFSVARAPAAGLTTSGPQTAHLTNHGTHGIGTFAGTHGETMIMVDGVAWRVADKDGKTQRAAHDAMMPFVQVCIYRPEYRVRAPEGLAKEGIWALVEGQGGRAGGRNSYMPFRLQGAFGKVDLRCDGGREAEDEAVLRTVRDVKGTVFGFAGPVWAGGISVVGLHCHFLGDEVDGVRTGGCVVDFVAGEGVVLDWAVCGRFHLGLPRGDEWESLELAA